MMRKTVLIHPGFHKTGTTTLQRGLWRRKDALNDQLDMLILEDIRPVSLMARHYSAAPAPRLLAKVSDAMASVLATRDPTDDRPLLISSEGLIGQIPGRNGFASYRHAPVLLERVVDVIRGFYGPQADVFVWFSTRDPQNWRKSVYYQNVRTARVTEDFAEYGPKLARCPSLVEIVCRVRARLLGQAVVSSSSLEATQDSALGLMGVVFDMLGVEAGDTTPPVYQNARSDVLMKDLLQLNRSALCETDLSVAKNELLRKHRKQRQRLARKARQRACFTSETLDPWELGERSQAHWSDGPYR